MLGSLWVGGSRWRKGDRNAEICNVSRFTHSLGFGMRMMLGGKVTATRMLAAVVRCAVKYAQASSPQRFVYRKQSFEMFEK
jgi:hypothetical protein